MMMQKLGFLHYLAAVVIANTSSQAQAGSLGYTGVISVGEEEFGNPNPIVDEGTLLSDADDTSGGPSLQTFAAAAVSEDAHELGEWSEAYSWPICPIHAILLKNGKILSYGTNPRGTNGAGFNYDIWDPTLGLSNPESHVTLDVLTQTNIFCSGQVNVPDTGEVLIMGGSQQIGSIRNFGINTTQYFNPDDNTLRLGERHMKYLRWYPSLTTLGNGNIFVQGGWDDAKRPTLTPELYYTKNQTWRQLEGSTSELAYRNQGWWYPKSYLGPDGSVVVVPPGFTNRLDIWNIWPESDEPLVVVGSFPGTKSVTKEGPSVMYDKNKILMFQDAQDASIVDISNPHAPVVTPAGSLEERRNWANTVALPNGEVLVVGGTSQENLEAYAVNYTEIWNPGTGEWRKGACASKSRLYHSTALLLADATVYVGGGGPPGDVVNKNAEIYKPPYLFNEDGSMAPRQSISHSLGSDPMVNYGETHTLTLLDPVHEISRVSFIRLGSVTHSFNMDERMQTLDFIQDGNQLDITITEEPNEAPPGYYHIFVVDEDGVPCESSIIVSLTTGMGSDTEPDMEPDTEPDTEPESGWKSLLGPETPDFVPLIGYNDYITSEDVRSALTPGFLLQVSPSGQLEVLQEETSTVLWRSGINNPNTSGGTDFCARLNRDCHLVVWQGLPSSRGQVRWNSQSAVKGNSRSSFLTLVPRENKIAIHFDTPENPGEEVWSEPLLV